MRVPLPAGVPIGPNRAPSKKPAGIRHGDAVGKQRAAIHISHLVKPGLTSPKSSSPFRLLPLHALYVHVCVPNFILCAYCSPLGAPTQRGFRCVGTLPWYVRSSLHKPSLLKPLSLPHFRFFFHHPPQPPVDLPSIGRPTKRPCSTLPEALSRAIRRPYVTLFSCFICGH
jgi:hypothetical protein